MTNYIVRFLSGIKFRTVWMAIGIIVLNGIPAVRDLVPAEYLQTFDVILGLLVIHFRTNPRVKIAPPA